MTEITDVLVYDDLMADLQATYNEIPPEYFNMTEKQWAFVFNYLETFDSKKAVVAAGYNVFKPRNITVQASALMNHPKIQFWISKFVEFRSLSADQVLARLADIATGSLADFIDVFAETGQIMFNLRKAEAAGKLHLVKRLRYIKSGPGKGGVEIELHDPLRALELIGKHLGMFQDVSVKVDQYTINVIREGDK